MGFLDPCTIQNVASADPKNGFFRANNRLCMSSALICIQMALQCCGSESGI
jgi:hypothetical protein